MVEPTRNRERWAARSAGLVLFCCSFTYSPRATAADPSWRAPEHWLRIHGAITPLYFGEVRGDDAHGGSATNPLLLGIGVQYLYRFTRNVGLGAGARYFAIQQGESCGRQIDQNGPIEVCTRGSVFGYELMLPVLLAIVVPWAKGFDSDLTLGLGYARAWVPGAFTSERRPTDGLYSEVGIGASYEVLEGLGISLRATVFVAGTKGQERNTMGYPPGYNFNQVGLPFELGVRKRW